MVNTVGFVTHFIRPYLYKLLYVLLRNLLSLRLNGYGFCVILYWFYFFTSGTVIYLSLGIYIIPELIQSDKNLFTRVLKVSVYGVKKIRIPLGNSILFLILGFNKVTPGVIFQRFGKCKGNFLKDDILAKVNVGFNILEMILFSRVVSIYFITGDKINSLLIIGITK